MIHEMTYNGVLIEVEGIYRPEERMVMYYPDMSGYPGAPAEFEIDRVILKGESYDWDITNIVDIDELQRKILDENY